MAAYQYVYHMDGVSKTYPGGKKCFENIRLSFLSGVKIGVVGVNGAGKSTLMKIMAGLDKDFTGEAWSAGILRCYKWAYWPRRITYKGQTLSQGRRAYLLSAARQAICFAAASPTADLW